MLIAWITGIVPAYFILRWTFWKSCGRKEWTTGLRILCIGLALVFSWVAAFAGLVALSTEILGSYNKKASW